MAERRFYNIWYQMRMRCSNAHSGSYERYGRKGIKVCCRWMDFDNFKKDMFPGYKSNLTLDRIDNNKNYFKNNCRWATYKEQENNRSNNRIVCFDGIKKNLTQWIEHFGLKASTVRQRFYVYRWAVDRCLERN